MTQKKKAPIGKQPGKGSTPTSSKFNINIYNLMRDFDTYTLNQLIELVSPNAKVENVTHINDVLETLTKGKREFAEAVLNLRNRLQHCPEERPVMRCAENIYSYFYPFLCDVTIEECWVLLLNQASRVIKRVKVGSGGLSSTAVDIRCILREALHSRATTIALCHNHPSGNTAPSREDDRLTDQLNQAAKLMNIRMIDHIIWTDGKYYSYADEGRL